MTNVGPMFGYGCELGTREHGATTATKRPGAIPYRAAVEQYMYELCIAWLCILQKCSDLLLGRAADRPLNSNLDSPTNQM